MAPMQGKAPDWDRIESALVSVVNSAAHAHLLDSESELFALRAGMRALDSTLAEQLGHLPRLRRDPELLVQVSTRARVLENAAEVLEAAHPDDFYEEAPDQGDLVATLREIASMMGTRDALELPKPGELIEDEKVGKGER